MDVSENSKQVILNKYSQRSIIYKRERKHTSTSTKRILSICAFTNILYCNKKVKNKETIHCSDCIDCYSALKVMQYGINIKISPPNSICNSLLCGYAPIELTQLNDIELSLVSKDKVNKHLFSY